MRNPRRWMMGATLILGSAWVCVPATAGVIDVHPGESIQAAVNGAAAGDTVRVHPGTYQEASDDGPAITVDKSLTLEAVIPPEDPGAKVILVANPGQTDGILVSPEPGEPNIGHFRIAGFTVKGFPNNGIHLRYVDQFVIENNESVENLENGIFPTLSANGLVRNNVAYGSDDSALWVEASTNVRVIDNVLHSSVTGLEVTISENVEMTGNHVYDNSVGVGLYHPSAAGLGSDFPTGGWIVSNNEIHDNNRPNTAPAGSMAADLPPGGGVLVLGADRIQVLGNRIYNNDFYGIAVVDFCTAVTGSAYDCNFSPPQVEPYPDDNMYGRNLLVNNGTAPPQHPFAPFAADLTYVVNSTSPDEHENRFCENAFATKMFPLELLGQPAQSSGWCEVPAPADSHWCAPPPAALPTT